MTELFNRDGTSQAHRLNSALQPEFVAVEERTLQDWLAFAQAFSKELKYFDVNNKASGDWGNFLNPEQLEAEQLTARWAEIEKFLAAPQNYLESKYASDFRRPHFVLFLAFLQLLKLTQGRLNTLTRRHLEFYYQEVLRLGKQPGIPDRVHIIVKASPQADQIPLPAGTLLNAGKDKLGKSLAYSTDYEIIVNHARVEQLSSVFVHKQITGIREAREQHQNDADKGLIAMLKMALGEPTPGDELPSYTSHASSIIVDLKLLRELQNLVKFASASAELFLELWELRSLLLRKNRQLNNNDSWTVINTLLVQAAKKRDPNFNQNITGKQFDANLNLALGQKLADVAGFNTLSEVKNIDDLYRQRNRKDVETFIDTGLHMSLSDFSSMMELKIAIDKDWQEVNVLLELASERKKINFKFPRQDIASADFDKNLVQALGQLSFPVVNGMQANNLDEYIQELSDLESYFFLKAEDFFFMMNTTDTLSPDWVAVYAKLAIAYKEKCYAARRKELERLKIPATPSLAEQYTALQNMLRLALDDSNVSPNDTNLYDRLLAYLPKGLDLSVVNKITKPDKLALLSDDDWQIVYEQLELVWRNRLGTEPIAEKADWHYLSANQDAKALLAEGDTARWRTFGQSLDLLDPNKIPEVKLGWMLKSPQLALSQGRRIITLTLGFQPAQFDQEKIATLANTTFLIQVSTAKGWKNVASTLITFATKTYVSADGNTKPLNALCWKLDLDASFPAITRLPPELTFLDNPYPVLRLLLSPHPDDKNANAYPLQHYPLLQSLLLERVLLEVEVQGLTDFKVQSDETLLKSTKPFEPFGTHPSVGSKLYFGHAEILSKRLKSVDLILQWMGVPQNLNSHYANYKNQENNDIVTDNSTFKATLTLLDNNLEIQFAKEAFSLFESDDARKLHTLADLTPQIRPGYVYERDLNSSSASDLTDGSRYFCLELNAPDFQHTAYPAIAAAKSIELATAIANKKSDDILATSYKVNPPYTPKLKSFSLNYKSEEEIVIADYQTGQGAEQIFLQHPFGYAEIAASKPTDDSGYCLFLPTYDFEGELYIGLSGVQPPQQLSILMQMAAGSANPDLELTQVEWSYLSGNQWLSLQNSNADQGHLSADNTHGLIDTGILQLQLAPVLPNTLLSPTLYWLRASMAKNCDSVCDTVGVHAQAVLATFVDRDNAPDHLNLPLPVATISKTLEPLANIAALQQPYTSFNGKPMEQDATFHVRVSERLRHKQRALSTWDYERLILEKFPQIYKVKCLPQNLPTQLSDSVDLGKVEIIVIPDIRARFPFNPFEPKAPAGLLAEIQVFLNSYIPPFASVTVKNALYVPVKVRVAVRFMSNFDPEYYKRQLNEDINRFLAPWAYDANSDIVIGGSIYANAIINFIERLDYVDYVAQFFLFTTKDGLIRKEPADSGYRVQAVLPNSVLAADREHQIDLITESRFVNENFSGIDYMRIELDFIVG